MRGSTATRPRAVMSRVQHDERGTGTRRRLLAAVCLCIAGSLPGAAIPVAQAAAGPRNTATPAITGTTVDGKRLKVSKGQWEGAKPISYAFQWARCDASGGSCVDIPAAAKATYKLTHEDVGHTLRATVFASNSGGEDSAESRPSEVVAPASLVKGKRPSVSGLAKDGQLLSVGNGTWKGTPPQSFAYQWQTCTKSGVCTDIAGATGSSYRVATAQIGSKLRALVTATNALGNASAVSRSSKPAVAGPPVEIAAPVIGGALQEGQTLSATSGDWAGTAPISYAYQWLRCSVLGGGCEEIPGAGDSTYTAGGADLASNLAVVVTATNAQGSAAATSAETQPILGILPTNSVLPSVSGLLQDGQLLSVATGVWSGTEPISYAYQWQLCNALGEACEAIEGATGSSLELDPSEIGKTLAVAVTATNDAGSSSATSAVSGLIAGILPKNTALPTIGGTLKIGQLLSVTNGTWTGSEPIAYTYQWQLCLLGSCSDIAKATSQTFLLGGLSLGSTLRAVVTAKNAAGSVPASTAITGPLGL